MERGGGGFVYLDSFGDCQEVIFRREVRLD